MGSLVQCLQRLKEGPGFSGAGVTEDIELANMGSGNRTQDLFKSKSHSYFSNPNGHYIFSCFIHVYLCDYKLYVCRCAQKPEEVSGPLEMAFSTRHGW